MMNIGSALGLPASAGATFCPTNSPLIKFPQKLTARWRRALGLTCPHRPCHRGRAGRILLEQGLHKGPFHPGWLTGWGRCKSARLWSQPRWRKSFGFFSRVGLSQEVSNFSIMFDDKNLFQVYNLMWVTMWTTSRAFKDRTWDIYRSCNACGTFNTISRNVGFASCSGFFVMPPALC